MTKKERKEQEKLEEEIEFDGDLDDLEIEIEEEEIKETKKTEKTEKTEQEQDKKEDNNDNKEDDNFDDNFDEDFDDEEETENKSDNSDKDKQENKEEEDFEDDFDDDFNEEEETENKSDNSDKDKQENKEEEDFEDDFDDDFEEEEEIENKSDNSDKDKQENKEEEEDFEDVLDEDLDEEEDEDNKEIEKKTNEEKTKENKDNNKENVDENKNKNNEEVSNKENKGENFIEKIKQKFEDNKKMFIGGIIAILVLVVGLIYGVKILGDSETEDEDNNIKIVKAEKKVENKSNNTGAVAKTENGNHLSGSNISNTSIPEEVLEALKSMESRLKADYRFKGLMLETNKLKLKTILGKKAVVIPVRVVSLKEVYDKNLQLFCERIYKGDNTGIMQCRGKGYKYNKKKLYKMYIQEVNIDYYKLLKHGLILFIEKNGKFITMYEYMKNKYRSLYNHLNTKNKKYFVNLLNNFKRPQKFSELDKKAFTIYYKSINNYIQKYYGNNEKIKKQWKEFITILQKWVK